MSNIERLINLADATPESLTLRQFSGRDFKIDILRLDKIHSIISGNKWFKLKYYLDEARSKNFDTIVTFGGAWSNHVIATAYASKIYGFNSIGVIRGEKPLKSSQTLQAAEGYGMTIEFVSREVYSNKNDERFRRSLEEKFGKVYFIPEGGAGPLGIEGSREITDLIELTNYSHVICCVGTGTMFTGIAETLAQNQQIIGISVLKGIEFSFGELPGNEMIKSNMKIVSDYHFGGYAKKTNELIQFMNEFYLETMIPTDFVYTAKMLFAFCDLASKNYFPAGSKILLIHSGGLQGNNSLPQGTLLF